MNFLKCNCGKIIKRNKCIILADFKNFTSRKIFFAYCPNCRNLILTLIEERQSVKFIFVEGHCVIKFFMNENVDGCKFLNLLYKEILKKRIIDVVSSISFHNLSGWLFGKNIQIRNKKGEIVEIRQYSSDFNGNTKLEKIIETN